MNQNNKNQEMIQKILETKNWTGLTVRKLAQAGRLSGNEKNVATKLLERTKNAVFDSQRETIKEFSQRWIRLVNVLEKELLKLNEK